MPVLTIKEVADSLKLTGKTIYKLISSGELHAVRVGGQWRVRQVDIDKLLAGSNGRTKKCSK